MTCFWDGLLKALHINHFKITFPQFSFRTKPRPREFIALLKYNSVPTQDVMWNGQHLKFRDMKDNFDAIFELDAERIHNGYLCSISDPYLFLVSQLFMVNIVHNYNGSTMRYTFNGPNYGTLNFQSDRGHFWTTS